MAQESTMKDIDVLVIGGGIAGTLAALKAKEAGASKIVIVDKGYTGNSGMAAFGAGHLWVYIPGEDNLEDQFRSTVRALGWLAQQDVIGDHFERVYGVVQDMENCGAEFEKTPDGKWERTLGRGKALGMRFHGPQMMESIARAVKKRGIELVRHTMVTDLLVNNGSVRRRSGSHCRS